MLLYGMNYSVLFVRHGYRCTFRKVARRMHLQASPEILFLSALWRQNEAMDDKAMAWHVTTVLWMINIDKSMPVFRNSGCSCRYPNLSCINPCPKFFKTVRIKFTSEPNKYYRAWWSLQANFPCWKLDLTIKWRMIWQCYARCSHGL